MRPLLLSALVLTVTLVALAPTPASARPCQELNGPNDFQCNLFRYGECEVAIGNHMAPGGHDWAGPDVTVRDDCAPWP